VPAARDASRPVCSHRYLFGYNYSLRVRDRNLRRRVIDARHLSCLALLYTDWAALSVLGVRDSRLSRGQCAGKLYRAAACHWAYKHSCEPSERFLICLERPDTDNLNDVAIVSSHNRLFTESVKVFTLGVRFYEANKKAKLNGANTSTKPILVTSIRHWWQREFATGPSLSHRKQLVTVTVPNSDNTGSFSCCCLQYLRNRNKIMQNSDKIRIYSSWKSSKAIDLWFQQKAHVHLSISHY